MPESLVERLLNPDSFSLPICISLTFYLEMRSKGKRLISHYTFEQDWDSWERHPAGFVTPKALILSKQG
jgi:hypothetical protein